MKSTDPLRRLLYATWIFASALFLAATPTKAAERPTLAAKKTTTSITIDGSLTDSAWAGLGFIALNRSVAGTPNNTVTFATLWDNTYLYVAVKVIDGNLYNDTAATWQDDSIEIFADANHNRGTTYDSYDRQFVKGYNDATLGGIGSQTGVLHGWAAITGGYTVEMAIPWSNLGITPVADTTVLGFDVGCNDDDNGGASRENHLVWAGEETNSSNTSAFGDCLLSSQTVQTIPLAPTGLSATVVSANQVNLAWTDMSSNETAFVVNRKTGTDDYDIVGSVGAGVVTFQDTTAAPSTTYSYQVQAENIAGSSPSAQVNATTPAARPTIAALKTLSPITVDGNLNESVWVLSNSASKLASGTGNNNTVSFCSLWNSTYLYVGIKVLDGNLYNDSPNTWQDDSAEVYIDANHSHSTTYDSFDRQYVKGYNDATLGGIGSQTGVVCAWAAVTGGYTVEMAIPWTNLGITPTADTTVIGLDVGCNDDDNGGNSRENHLVWSGTEADSTNTADFGDCFISGMTVGTPPPAAPSGLNSPTLTDTSVSLVWVDNSTDEGAFSIEQKIGAGSYAEIATVGANVVAYTSVGLSPSTTYKYRVRSSNTSGYSSYSNELTVTTSATASASWSGLPLPTLPGYSGSPVLFQRDRTGWLTQSDIDTHWNDFEEVRGKMLDGSPGPLLKDYPWRRIAMTSPDGSLAFSNTVTTANTVYGIAHGTYFNKVNTFRGAVLRYQYWGTNYTGKGGKLIEFEGGRGWIGNHYHLTTGADSNFSTDGWGYNSMRGILAGTGGQNRFEVLVSHEGLSYGDSNAYGDTGQKNGKVWPLNQWITVDMVVDMTGSSSPVAAAGYYLNQDTVPINPRLGDKPPRNSAAECKVLGLYIRTMHGGNPEDEKSWPDRNYTEYFRNFEIFIYP